MGADSVARALALAALQGGGGGGGGDDNPKSVYVDLTWYQNHDERPAEFDELVRAIYDDPEAYNVAGVIWDSEYGQPEYDKADVYINTNRIKFIFKTAISYNVYNIEVEFDGETGEVSDVSEGYHTRSWNDDYHPIPGTTLWAEYSNGTLNLYDHDPNE